MSGQEPIKELFSHIPVSPHALSDPDTAYMVINENKVLGHRTLPGLEVRTTQLPDGIKAEIELKPETVIAKTVHFCFGMIPEKGIQRIVLRIHIGKNSKIAVQAHCVFPNAVDIQHIMDAEIQVDDNAEYSYFERHIHGNTGGARVYPTAKINLGESARFKTEFELLKGRVGVIDIDFETTCARNSVMEMTARINGTGNDVIKIRESGNLAGEDSVGVLTSKIAVRENATAEVNNRLIATAEGARGHVDCKEIVRDSAKASAVPVVEVRHPRAHVTHEAAIGSVDSKQMETLMSRGLTENEAVELIIQGLLS